MIKTIAARREHFSVLKVEAAQRENAKLSSLSPRRSLLSAQRLVLVLQRAPQQGSTCGPNGLAFTLWLAQVPV